MQTETGPDPYMEGTSDTWFVIQCEGRADGEEVKWGDAIELVSHRWRAPVGVALQGASAGELLGEREAPTEEAVVGALIREASMASASSGQGEGVPFKPSVWYKVLAWADRAKGRVRRVPRPLPRAVGIGVLAALRAGTYARSAATGVAAATGPGPSSRRSSLGQAFGDAAGTMTTAASQGFVREEEHGAVASTLGPASSRWRVVRAANPNESGNSLAAGSGVWGAVLAPSFARLEAEGGRMVAEHDELRGASRRGRRAVRLQTGAVAEPNREGPAVYLDNVW